MGVYVEASRVESSRAMRMSRTRAKPLQIPIVLAERAKMAVFDVSVEIQICA